MNFPEGPSVRRTVNRHKFSRRAVRKDVFFQGRVYLFVEQTFLFHRTDTNFIKNPYFIPQTHTNFPGASIFSSNRYSRKPYLASPRILTIFQKTLSSPRTHTTFQEIPMPQTHRHFPGRYPLYPPLELG